MDGPYAVRLRWRPLPRRSILVAKDYGAAVKDFDAVGAAIGCTIAEIARTRFDAGCV